MSAQLTPFWVVIPAAGSARRMGPGAVPKQYLRLAGSTIIELAIAPFLARHECQGVVVVLADSDQRWSQLAISHEPRVSTAIGGTERADSVRAGLASLNSRLKSSDWVLVHDAARPCLEANDLDSLLNTLADDEVGGLLATPVVDTLKRADASARVSATVDRTGLWRAMTPQMFRFEVLCRALDEAQRNGMSSTDEAQAIEALGLKPRLVAGSTDNIKITMPDDIARAERILDERDARHRVHDDRHGPTRTSQ
jgi:2-C-methyl-D-erythritol 4-phosphate cytidylyltransferase